MSLTIRKSPQGKASSFVGILTIKSQETDGSFRLRFQSGIHWIDIEADSQRDPNADGFRKNLTLFLLGEAYLLEITETEPTEPKVLTTVISIRTQLRIWDKGK